MNFCEEYTVDLLLYLDNELGGTKLEQFLEHLKLCAHCSETLEQQIALTAILRQSRPLYSASENLRARVAADLARSASGLTSARPYEHTLQRVREVLLGVAGMVPRWHVLVPAVPIIALCFLLTSNAIRQVRAAEYVETALSTHQSYLTGNLPLEFRSASPQAVSGWLADKVPFPFRLPASQEGPGTKPAYRLVGARLIAYRGNQAALVIYEGIQHDIISLLVAASNHAVAAGGVEVRSHDLVFHYRSDSGFQAITWSTHGLTYALVSRGSGSASGSCLVCHEGMRDRDAFLSAP